MLQAIQKIPHGWMPLKLGFGLWISRFVVVLGMLFAGLVFGLSSGVTRRLETIAMGIYFGLGFIIFLGMAETVDLDLFLTLLLFLGMVIALTTKGYLGIAIVLPASALKICLGIVWLLQKLRSKRLSVEKA